MKENSIEEDMKYIHKTLNDMKIKDEDAFMSAVATIFRDYKRVLRENEKYQKSDYETICLENEELKEINERLESENQEFLYKYGNVLKENEKLKDKYATFVKISSEVIANSIAIQKVENKIEELDNQQRQWSEDRNLKAGDSEIIFARDVLQELIESEQIMSEDIKILENWLEELNKLFNETHINNTKERKALDHILSDYKRIL